MDIPTNHVPSTAVLSFCEGRRVQDAVDVHVWKKGGALGYGGDEGVWNRGKGGGRTPLFFGFAIQDGSRFPFLPGNVSTPPSNSLKRSVVLSAADVPLQELRTDPRCVERVRSVDELPAK